MTSDDPSFKNYFDWLYSKAKESGVTTVNSTSDERVVNNVMRHEYRLLGDLEKDQMRSLKDMGLAFVESCDRIGASREMSLAKTKMEEAVMWAVKHITR